MHGLRFLSLCPENEEEVKQEIRTQFNYLFSLLITEALNDIQNFFIKENTDQLNDCFEYIENVFLKALELNIELDEDTYRTNAVEDVNDFLKTHFNSNKITFFPSYTDLSEYFDYEQNLALYESVLETLIIIKENVESYKILLSIAEHMLAHYHNYSNPSLLESSVEGPFIKSHKSNLNSKIYRYVHEIEKFEPGFAVKKQEQQEGSFGACYIATAIYGDYNSPEVKILRGYRDNVLIKTYFGRLFIKAYYFLSPKIVKHFYSDSFITRLTKMMLNKVIFLIKRKNI